MPEDKKLDPQALKERLGKHLRTADEHTRSGRFDEAILEIQQALDIDPKNNYARSFLERVKLMNKRSSQQKESEQTVPEDLTFEERMELISQHLSAAEGFINKKEYKHALEEVAQVYKIDSNNYYAQTYSERIETLMLEEEAEQTAKKKAEEFAKRKEIEESARREAEESEKKEAEERAKREAERIAKEEAAKKRAAEEAAKREEAAKKTAENKSVEEVVLSVFETKRPQREVERAGQTERGSIIMYRELLKESWFDGKLTEEEIQELSGMRELFGITKDEHDNLEREIRIESYVEALRIAWHDNVISDTEQKMLKTMQEKYAISQEEQKAAEARYEEIRKSAKARNVILVVDPDRDVLVALNKLLKQYGYIIFMAQKTEDALQILNTQTPNCIISEVIFPKPQMDGVSFLKKIREIGNLKHVPFFFISSIKDKKVESASYRLGIDYFLMKPIDTTNLLSMIEGKLRA